MKTRHRSLRVAAAAVGACLLPLGLTSTALADVAGFTAFGCSTWSVPAGLLTGVQVEATGAAGANAGGTGGTGDELIAELVNPSGSPDVWVGGAGGAGRGAGG